MDRDDQNSKDRTLRGTFIWGECGEEEKER